MQCVDNDVYRSMSNYTYIIHSYYTLFIYTYIIHIQGVALQMVNLLGDDSTGQNKGEFRLFTLDVHLG